VAYRKFEIGIKKFEDKYKRKSQSDLIYEILLSARMPLHVKEVWKMILKQRGFPKYAVEQKLYEEPRFIKIAAGTYTVEENIFLYKEKSKIIIDFAEEWCQIKKRPISAFLISEVLKETGKIKDLSLVLVEYVLEMSPKFVKLVKGFYALVEDQTA